MFENEIDYGKFIAYLWDIITLLIFDIIVPVAQSLIPGTNESIWAEGQYLFLVLLIILLSVYRVMIKMGMAKW